MTGQPIAARIAAPRSSRPSRRAVIDVGTNSVRLLVADVAVHEGAVRLSHVHRDLAMPRLGRGVDRTGRLSDDAMQAAAGVVESFVRQARELGAENVEVIGTSALRDAVNRDEFIALVRRRADVEVRVISGRDEAALSFLGAVRGTPVAVPGAAVPAPAPGAGEGAHARKAGCETRPAEAPPVYVLDIGGGSTELVRGRADGTMESAVSVDVGSVRMTELCVRSDPVSDADWTRLVEEVRARLAPIQALRAGAGVLLAVGGTATTLAAVKQRLRVYDPRRVHGFVLTRQDVAELAEALRQTPVAQRRTWPGLQPQRADVIVAGAVIAREVLSCLGAERLVVSESDLLEGVLIRSALAG